MIGLFEKRKAKANFNNGAQRKPKSPAGLEAWNHTVSNLKTKSSNPRAAAASVPQIPFPWPFLAVKTIKATRKGFRFDRKAERQRLKAGTNLLLLGLLPNGNTGGRKKKGQREGEDYKLGLTK